MRRILAVVAVAVVCLSVGVGVGAAAHEEADRTIFGVELDADGDATVYNVTSYDLSEEAERERYEEFDGNETAQEEWRTVVVADMEAAAASGREAAPLEMRVHNATVRTYEQTDDDGNEFGRVEVRAEWEELAYHHGEYDLEGLDGEWALVIEPFSIGYEPGPTRVAIHGPEGYERGTNSRPEPLRAQRNAMLWNPRTSDFSEFYAFYTAIDDGGENGDDGAVDNGGSGSDDGNSGLGLFVRALVIALVPAAIVVVALRRRGT